MSLLPLRTVLSAGVREWTTGQGDSGSDSGRLPIFNCELPVDQNGPHSRTEQGWMRVVRARRKAQRIEYGDVGVIAGLQLAAGLQPEHARRPDRA